MISLFFVHTPYHLLLASGIALAKKNSNTNVLVIYRDFEFDDSYFEKSASLYRKTLVLFGNLDHSKSGLLGKLSYQRLFFRNIRRIKELFRKEGVAKIYVFNDQRVENKKAMQFCTDSRNCKVTYVEDGSAVYSSSSSPRKHANSIVQEMKRIIYCLNEPADSSAILGSSKLINEQVVLFPELVRTELTKRKVTELTAEELTASIRFLFGSVIDKIDSLEYSVVIFLDLYDFVSCFIDRYMAVITSIIYLCKNMNKTVYVKYHPREEKKYASHLQSFSERVYFIDKTIPSEAVNCKCERKVIFIGSLSTSLITASKISKDVLRVSIMKLLSLEDKNLRMVFERLGVMIPENQEELFGLIEDFFMAR